MPALLPRVQILIVLLPADVMDIQIRPCPPLVSDERSCFVTAPVGRRPWRRDLKRINRPGVEQATVSPGYKRRFKSATEGG